MEKFGHRDFWIYIYYENKARIHNPNRLPVGFKLTLPDAAKYRINVNNPKSVAKAKKLSDKMIKTIE